MTAEQSGPGQPGADSTTLRQLGALLHFQGTPQDYVAALLRMQCTTVGGVEGGAIVRLAPDGGPKVLAAFPAPGPQTPRPAWLDPVLAAAAQAAAAPDSLLKPLRDAEDLYGAPARRHLLLIPLRAADLTGVAAFVLTGRDDAALVAARSQLELAVGYLSLYEMRVALGQRQSDFERLHAAMGALASVSEHDRFVAVAMALCNEVAARWSCERVGLGFLKRRCVELRAMSHTEKFSRKMKVVQDIEAAMEECLDQDVEILHPADPEAMYVSRAAADLARRHGPATVVSLPLRRDGEVRAVLTLERPADQPFEPGEIEAVRLTCDLCTPLLMNLHEHDRWIGARMAGGLRRFFASLIGPKHTWRKVAALLVLVAVVLLVVLEGDHTADAPFVLQPTQRRVAPAPFNGKLLSVEKRVGDVVEGGKTVLARLDVSELKTQVARLAAQRVTRQKEAATAMRDDKRVEAQIARARADEITAQIDLLEHQIASADIIAPISGVVVTGDIERFLGSRREPGEVLFEIAPVKSLRAELSVPQDAIAYVVKARAEREASGTKLTGKLATASFPRRKFQFTVTRINPMAELAGKQNVFKARAELGEAAPWMEPGMEGLAKIHIGRRRLIWLWTHRAIDWLRMKLWL
jgi:multidrug efflux pump subunit AcrA (membrane-fusion protein)